MSCVTLRLTGCTADLRKAVKPQISFSRTKIFSASFPRRRFSYRFKFDGSTVRRRRGFTLRRSPVRIASSNEGLDDFSLFDEWGDNEGVSSSSSYILSSSGEDSDTEVIINPIGDVDLPRMKERFDSSDGGFAVTTYRLAMLRRRRKTNRTQPGLVVNLGLIGFMIVLLLFVDWCSWKIVRIPLPPFHLTRPFCISAVLTSCVGYLCIQVYNSLRIYQNIRKEGPNMHFSKKGTLTMGGLFFIPIGIVVARFISGSSSVEVSGVAVATLAFATIGLLDDIFSIVKNHNHGLPAWAKIFLEVATGTWFGFWLNSTNGLDGLASGTVALAFIGMSIAVLPICSDISIFGASMAGACVGFLTHNRYKASIFMGDVGSLALGGALAAMSACTGMFLPLFISSGIFVLEAVSVIFQVLYFKATKHLYGTGCRLFKMAPFHHHLELCGYREPHIVATAYVVSAILSVVAGYVGLISA